MNIIQRFFSSGTVGYNFMVVLTFESVDEILECGHWNENYWAVLSCGTVYYDVQGASYFESVVECDHSNKSNRKLLFWGAFRFFNFSQDKIFLNFWCLVSCRKTHLELQLGCISYIQDPPKSAYWSNLAKDAKRIYSYWRNKIPFCRRHFSKPDNHHGRTSAGWAWCKPDRKVEMRNYTKLAERSPCILQIHSFSAYWSECPHGCRSGPGTLVTGWHKPADL